MADPAVLLLALESLLLWGWRRDWVGRRLLVTAGPTQEFLDPVRCLTNPSSGLMGVLLAQAARFRGARVDLIHGPLRLDPALLEGVQCHPVQSAAQLQQGLRRLQPEMDAIAMAAAVADHRPAAPQVHKADKQTLLANLEGGWLEVPDLLAELAANRPAGQKLLGFAAQSGQVLPQATEKFGRKGCDLLFANPIDQPGAGFGVPTNRGWLLGPGERQEEIAPSSKLALAHRLLTALAALLEPLTLEP